MADVLRTISTPKGWIKHLPFVEFAINNSVHASTGAKHAVLALPGGTTKLLPRLIGPFTVVEEFGDLNYSLSLPHENTPRILLESFKAI